MDDIFIGRVMSSPVETVHHSAPMQTAAEKMQECNIGSLIVTDKNGEYLGIITASDCIDAIADGIDTWETDVNSYITTRIATAKVQSELQDVADMMMENQIHHVPVVDDENQVVGIITTTDLTGYLSHVQSPTPD